MAELVDAIAQVHGTDAARRVRYEPGAAIEQRFGGFPPLQAAAAQAAGFHADDSLAGLVRRALDGTNPRAG
jgi:D-erythronate 2-dehydrogenase